ncbi:WD domain G-beta repeat domain-containing protein [Phytophthora infestans]|uniref:WD domain G-beta repeat domain-containing protein n=1 Tax=Phytophthora infestans TaxID=4787 RepID=A0A8S9TTJ8_PHYIN|nr:WD domain G-beta repeat domain-containing protein [Phytophthora infestans]
MFLCCAAGLVTKTFEVTSETITHQRTLSLLNADVSCARYNHNGRILASSSVEGGICLNVASSGELLSRFFNPGEAPANRRVNAVQFSSGSRFLASGGNDGCVRLWDLKTQETMQTYNISASVVTSVAFSGYKDEFIVGGSASGAISVCDVQTAETAGFLTVDPAHGVHKVMTIQASPHPYARHTLGSTYSDGSVRVWDLSTGQLKAEFVRQHEAPATSLTLSPVSKVLLATGGLDGRVIFYDTLQRKKLRSLDLEQPVSSLALCADGKTLAVGTTTGEILVYDLRGAITPLFSTLVHETSGVHSLQFSPPPSDVVTTGVIPEGVPVVSAEHVSPCKGETLQEIAVRKLEALGMGSPTRKHEDKPGLVHSSPPSSPTRFATRIAEPSEPASPQSHSNGFATPTQSSPSRPFANARSELATVQGSMDERWQSKSSAVSSLLSALSRRLSEQTSDAFSPSKQINFGKSKLRAEVQRLREEMELRRQEEIDQLSTLLENLMDRFDAIVEENRSLREENEWLKSHVPAS